MGNGFSGEFRLFLWRSGRNRLFAGRDGISAYFGYCGSSDWFGIFRISFLFWLSLPGKREADRIFLPEGPAVSDVMGIIKRGDGCGGFLGILYLHFIFGGIFSVRHFAVSAVDAAV